MQPAINPTSSPISEVVALLRSKVETLPANDQGFAYSLLSAASMRGLSDKQAMWVRKLADRAVNPQATPATVNVGDIAGLVALFDKAKASGLKWPKLRAAGEAEAVFTVTIAGEKSRHKGDLFVVTGKGDAREYLGRVDRTGVFHPTSKPSPETLTACAAALRAMATDPAAAGKAYGQRTGSCAFCSLPLDDGRSVHVGYGPVCAEKWGLPWGEAPTKRKAVARR